MAAARLRARCGEHAGDGALVVGRPAAVAVGRAVRRGHLARLLRTAPRTAPGRRAPPRRASMCIVVGPTALQATPAHWIVPPSIAERGRGRDDREVAGAPLDLLVRAAEAGVDREADLDEHLGRLHGGHVRADVELLHPDDALAAARTAQNGLALERHDDAGEVLGGVGLAQRAAHRAAVADDRVGEHGLGLRKMCGNVRVEQIGLEHVHVARQRADADLVALLADVVQLRLERVDVDHVTGIGEAQLHHRDEAVAARPGCERCRRALQAALWRRRRSLPASSRKALGSALPRCDAPLLRKWSGERSYARYDRVCKPDEAIA